MTHDLGSMPRDTVSWDVSAMKLFVNRYIRTRQRPVNDFNRRAVGDVVRRYPGRFPALCAELEQFLDSHLVGVPDLA